MSKTLDLIRNAKDGSYVDFRTADNQIDSVPIEDLRALLDEPCRCITASDILNSYPVPDNFSSPITRDNR